MTPSDAPGAAPALRPHLALRAAILRHTLGPAAADAFVARATDTAARAATAQSTAAPTTPADARS